MSGFAVSPTALTKPTRLRRGVEERFIDVRVIFQRGNTVAQGEKISQAAQEEGNVVKTEAVAEGINDAQKLFFIDRIALGRAIRFALMPQHRRDR